MDELFYNDGSIISIPNRPKIYGTIEQLRSIGKDAGESADYDRSRYMLAILDFSRRKLYPWNETDIGRIESFYDSDSRLVFTAKQSLWPSDDPLSFGQQLVILDYESHPVIRISFGDMLLINLSVQLSDALLIADILSDVVFELFEHR